LIPNKIKERKRRKIKENLAEYILLLS